MPDVIMDSNWVNRACHVPQDKGLLYNSAELEKGETTFKPLIYVHQIPKLKYFSSSLAVVFAQSIEVRF